MSNIQNFDLTNYVKKVIAGCHLENEKPELLEQLEEAIGLRAMNRIIATVTSYFTNKEVAQVAEILEKDPEAEEFEAMMVVAGTVPDMEKHLEKALDDLYSELTYDANEIGKAMERAKKEDK